MTQSNVTLPATHGDVRTALNNNATDAETRLSKPDKLRGGWVNISDLTTQSSPISVSASTDTVLTNDAAGSFTSFSYAPEGITSAVFSDDQFHWDELSIGDMVNIRFDIEITTTSANETVDIVLRSAVGSASEFTIPFESSKQFKNSGTYNMTGFSSIFIGSADVRDYPAQFEINTDSNSTVVVNGWYAQLLLLGET